MELQGKKVLVVGTGISGIGAAKALSKVGACPVLYDENDKVVKEEIEKKLSDACEDKEMKAIQVITGTLPDEVRNAVELVVLSPGVPVDAPLADGFRRQGVKIWGEIELAYELGKGKVVAITGTNGKTTTTSLVGEIMRAHYESVYVVGNIGNPYTMTAFTSTDDTVTVAEISSFQLETIETFHPAVSAILNITPDHLNRHHTMENYIAAKESITCNQTKEDVCVLNYENEYTRAFGEKCPAKVIYFSSARKLEDGLYLDGEDICLAGNSHIDRLMNIHDMNLVGMCNVENVMAAIAIALSMDVPMEKILKTVKSFKAVEHRIEFVASKRGVVYYNDSKATNPDAAIQGIKAMDRPTVLIGGGYDKQNEYDEWIEAFDGKVKCFVLIGQTKEKIAACAKAHGISNIVFADTFKEAFDICVEQAEAGDAVLLSPACASWGMFPNYEVRGRDFKEFVNQLEE
ncbi:MAG: UDP-N-acetylmuramoyl-L-alanine--D-glutamate ligase [Lachnospiraceae bacterium]|nr:UDP-N-acetylmuramoyl-L-alanine--D-glutamate ligase [Lachnospiraceae bacterium]